MTARFDRERFAERMSFPARSAPRSVSTSQQLQSWAPFTRSTPATPSRTAKEKRVRALNIAVAAVGIVVTSPVMLAIAALVKLTSPGPAIYKQTRVGVDRRGARMSDPSIRRKHDIGGVPFAIYKFRTMRSDSGAAQVWASKNDNRVTAVGRVLRKYRLDELPQLFNVLLGDMNVVGPRPEQPKLFDDLRQKIELYPARQQVLPGITGWAQVNLSYDSCLDDVRKKLDCDLEYIRRRSSLEDLRIMARTLPVMLGKRGGW
jgi:lipopolysaccharide/colanic/teichoic acid biosynthesis glycosyltransferase